MFFWPLIALKRGCGDIGEEQPYFSGIYGQYDRELEFGSDYPVSLDM